VIRRYIPQALDRGFSDLFRLTISCVSSVFENSNKVWLYETSQVGRIHTGSNFLGKTTTTIIAERKAERTFRICSPLTAPAPIHGAPVVQSSVIIVHEGYFVELRRIQHRKVNNCICPHALGYAVPEIVVFVTSARHLSQRSSEFRHEPTGEVEERGQEKKMKFHFVEAKEVEVNQ
jgi:hypothetical protein